MTGILNSTPTEEWRMIPVGDVIVRDLLRTPKDEDVERIMQSFRDLGGQVQLQPIVLDGDLVLIDGAHRLEAAKRSGWTHISSMIREGVTTEDRHILGIEANVVRKQFSPLELQEAWANHYAPAFQAVAKQRQLAGVSAAPVASADDARGDLPGNSWKVTGADSSENDTLVSPAAAVTSAGPRTLAQAARETVGLDPRTLDKIQEIKVIAHSESAAPRLRDAALVGLKKLSVPGSKVDPIHKELLAMQEAIKQQNEDPEERLARTQAKFLGKVLDETTILAERFQKTYSVAIESAARVAPGGREQVAAIRIALTHALAHALAAEVNLEPEPSRPAMLDKYGSDVTRLLSELTIDALGLTPVSDHRASA